MEKMAEVAEGNWSVSWPGTMQEEAEHQMDRAEAYEMMNRICEYEGVKELNL